MDYWAHQSSFIDDEVIIGDNTKIWHFCHICSGAKIGNNCVLGHSVFVAPGVIIGNGCKIQNHVSLYKGVILEDYVFVGPSVCFTNVRNPRAFIERKNEFIETIIKIGATIGANTTIVCGNTIGSYAFIAAGSVVTKDVDAFTMVVGNPARFMKSIDSEVSNL